MRTKISFLKAAAVSTAFAAGWDIAQERPRNNRSLLIQKAVERSTGAIQRFKEVKGIPGISVAVSVNGEMLWVRGFGFANVEQLSPCTEDTVMRIASISKPITMTLAAKLWEDGKLDLDAPVQTYVPDFPKKTFDGEDVTITTRLLTSHLGGIRHYHEKKEERSEMERDEYFNRKEYKNVLEALEMFKHCQLKEKPGSKLLYTTHGWTLISAVIEGAGGKKFEDQLKEMLAEFGMNSTFLDKNSPVIANRAQYYVRKKKELQNVSEVNNSYKWAGGGLLSSVRDLIRFANVMLFSFQTPVDSDTINSPKTFLKSGTVRQLWNPVAKEKSGKFSYGMGWQLPVNSDPDSESRFVYHGGGIIGATSMLLIRPNIPGNGVCVAIVCNLQECAGLRYLAEGIAQEFSCIQELSLRKSGVVPWADKHGVPQ